MSNTITKKVATGTISAMVAAGAVFGILYLTFYGKSTSWVNAEMIFRAYVLTILALFGSYFYTATHEVLTYDITTRKRILLVLASVLASNLLGMMFIVALLYGESVVQVWIKLDPSQRFTCIVVYVVLFEMFLPRIIFNSTYRCERSKPKNYNME